MRSAAKTHLGEAGCWPQVEDRRLVAFLRHWAERRDGLRTPRDRIDPAALSGLLAHVWMYRWVAEDDAFVCSLAGEAVQEAWGRSLIGKRLQDFARPDDATIIDARYRDVIEIPAIQYSRRRVVPSDQVEREAERLILPLSDAEGRPYGVFGISIYRFDPVVATGRPMIVNADAVIYRCDTLPAGLPE